MKKLGLLPRLLIGIVLGIIIGLLGSKFEFDVVTRIFMTISGIFSQFLNYIIPLLIIAFIAPGIAELGTGAGKLLGITAGLSYISTIIAGITAFFLGTFALPMLIPAGVDLLGGGVELAAYFEITINPIMDVMAALITAFLLGLGMAATKSEALYKVTLDFQKIIELTIDKAIIPLLPIHIIGIFSNMAYSGEVFGIMAVFGKVFLLVIGLHWAYLVVQFLVAGTIAGVNPLGALRTMFPAYMTAVGTQSSAATIPVTTQMAKKVGVSDKIADFVIPLCATIHLSGSTITLTLCSLAVMFIGGIKPEFSSFLPFILMLGVTMIAAPGVPGGAVMAALGLLTSMLGFTEANIGLMIALYMAQDSFGTACNVTGDASIAMIVDRIFKNKQQA